MLTPFQPGLIVSPAFRRLPLLWRTGNRWAICRVHRRAVRGARMRRRQPLAHLRLLFPQMQRAAIAAGQSDTGNGPFIDRVWERAQGLLTVRQGDEVVVGNASAVALPRQRCARGGRPGRGRACNVPAQSERASSRGRLVGGSQGAGRCPLPRSPTWRHISDAPGLSFPDHWNRNDRGGGVGISRPSPAMSPRRLVRSRSRLRQGSQSWRWFCYSAWCCFCCESSVLSLACPRPEPGGEGDVASNWARRP